MWCDVLSWLVFWLGFGFGWCCLKVGFVGFVKCFEGFVGLCLWVCLMFVWFGVLGWVVYFVFVWWCVVGVVVGWFVSC